MIDLLRMRMRSTVRTCALVFKTKVQVLLALLEAESWLHFRLRMRRAVGTCAVTFEKKTTGRNQSFAVEITLLALLEAELLLHFRLRMRRAVGTCAVTFRRVAWVESCHLNLRSTL